MTAAEVLVHQGPDELAAAVAARWVRRLREIQDEGRVPAVSLTGGSIAARVHAAVLDVHRDVDWSRVDVWFGDDRYLPATHGDRNAVQADEAMLRHLPLAPERVHPMPASDDGFVDLDAAAAAYGEEIRTQGDGAFDVMMLGLGPDGHVASLFPGHPALDVDDRLAVGVPDSPKPPPERISLTLAALNRSHEVWFVVSGDDKAPAVADALRGAEPHRTPAAGVSGRSRTLWLIDEGAAALQAQTRG